MSWLLAGVALFLSWFVCVYGLTLLGCPASVIYLGAFALSAATFYLLAYF